jgi:glycosyltransferase involved in cell wall biosynthesis
VKRALLVQASIQPPGGGNAVAAWILEALRERYRLSILTWRPVNVAAVNRYFGTTLSAHDLETETPPALLRCVINLIPLPLALLKNSLLMRLARRRSGEFDLVLSGNNEMDFGRRGLQYVHYPTYLRPRPRADWRWYHTTWLVYLYNLCCDRIAGLRPERLAANLSLVNSGWTGLKFRRLHGVEPRTLYPPVTGRFPDVPWDTRHDEFVCAGRISPEKELDTVIDIVAAVRRKHPHVRLRLIGTRDHWWYTRRVLARAARHADWISVHLDATHVEVRRLMSECRYGLHAMLDEHFGMAPAEMATAGCIVWVRDEGGQVEIVGGEPRLMFRSVDEAVTKILRVMEDPAEQASLRALLAARAPRFGVERFVAGVRAAADEIALPPDAVD